MSCSWSRRTPNLLWEGTAAYCDERELARGVHAERVLSGRSCVGVGAAGKGITMLIASLCFGGSDVGPRGGRRKDASREQNGMRKKCRK